MEFDEAAKIGDCLGSSLTFSDLHPWSQSVLMEFLSGAMYVQEFLQKFSLPNSDYIGKAQCLAQAFAPFL